MTTKKKPKKNPVRCLRCGATIKALPLCSSCIRQRDAGARVTK